MGINTVQYLYNCSDITSYTFMYLNQIAADCSAAAAVAAVLVAVVAAVPAAAVVAVAAVGRVVWGTGSDGWVVVQVSFLGQPWLTAETMVDCEPEDGRP